MEHIETGREDRGARPGARTRPRGQHLAAARACLALPLFAVTAGCVIRSADPGMQPLAPIQLSTVATELHGQRLDAFVTLAEETVARVPFDTFTIREAAQSAGACVVSLYVKTRAPHRINLLPFGPGIPVTLPGDGLGSGFFVHSDGYLITNEHVVRRADEIWALTAAGQSFELEVVAVDPAFDLALLRVAAPGFLRFPVLPMGDSDEVQVGDVVIAVGNPLGLGQTVTLGIVSQTDRSLSGVPDAIGREVEFLQTDAAINPGSSGGPLVTMTGAWVGVNTAGLTGSQGIGFTVPSRQVREFVEAVLAGQGEPLEP